METIDEIKPIDKSSIKTKTDFFDYDTDIRSILNEKINVNTFDVITSFKERNRMLELENERLRCSLSHLEGELNREKSSKYTNRETQRIIIELQKLVRETREETRETKSWISNFFKKLCKNRNQTQPCN